MSARDDYPDLTAMTKGEWGSRRTALKAALDEIDRLRAAAETEGAEMAYDVAMLLDELEQLAEGYIEVGKRRRAAGVRRALLLVAERLA